MDFGDTGSGRPLSIYCKRVVFLKKMSGLWDYERDSGTVGVWSAK